MPFVALCVPGHGLPMSHCVARIFGIFVAWHDSLFCVVHVIWMTVAVLGMLVHIMIEVVDVRVRIELTKAIFSLRRQLFDFC